MSSLAAQLAGIKTNSNATILDKSKRKKIHSVSLIFDPKEAAQQDFETIYYTCIDKFREMELLDPRYSKFAKSLFSETSIRFDRQVQDAEHVDGLNFTIQQFFMLNAAYLHLTPALYCLEWLIRRFQVNVLNAEDLILSSLPSYNTAEFLRILEVIPVQSLPPMFKWLSNAKQQMQSPSRNTIVRILSSDKTLFDLVNRHFDAAIAKGYDNNKLMVFWSSINVWVLMVFKEAGDASILDIVLPLLSKLVVMSDKPSIQIASYMVFVVLCSQFSLDQDVTDAVISTITQTWSNTSRVQGLACISQLVRYSDERTAPFTENEWTKIASIPNVGQELLNLARTHSVGAFTVRYSASLLKYAPVQMSKLKPLLKSTKLTEVQLQSIFNGILGHLSDQPIDLVEWISKTHPDLFNKCLKQSGLTLDKVEMALQTSLSGLETPEPEAAQELEQKQVTSKPDESLEKELTNLKHSSAASYLNYETYHSESSRLKLWVQASSAYHEDQLIGMMHISPAAEPSFLLAVAISPFPVVARHKALSILAKRLTESDKDYQVLLPAVLYLLSDKASRIRRSAVIVLKSMENSSKNTWGLDTVYGNGKIKAISRNDLKTVFKFFISKADECILDSQQIKKIGGSVGKSSWIEVLIKHALSSDLPQIFQCVLGFLHGHKGVTKELHSLFETYIEARAEWEKRCSEFRLPLSIVDDAIIDVVYSNDKVGIQFLELALVGPEELASRASRQVVAIWSSLREENQEALFTKLLAVSVDNSADFDPSATLHELPISASNFAKVLEQYKSTSNDGTETKRRRRSSNAQPTAKPGQEIESHLRQVTLVLELLNEKIPSLENPMKVFSVLFDILNELVTFTNSNIPVLYTQSLLADCLISLLDKIKMQKLSKDALTSIRVDVLVNCVRTSSNPQNQNKFLLLIASLAPFCPDLVFHSVMPIFTFMGANTVRLDNDYSAFVIQQTISKVIPALIENGDKTEEIEIALRSFVAAFPHIPRHRRNKLFGALIKTLGPSDSLHKLLLLLAQKYSESQSRKKTLDSKALVHFTTPFLRAFTIDQQLEAVDKYLTFVTTGEGLQSELPVSEMSNDLYEFLDLTFGNEAIISGTQPLFLQISTQESLSEFGIATCSHMIENLLTVTARNAGEGPVFDVLSKCLELLPIDKFVTVLTELANQEVGPIKSKVLQLVERKFELSKDKAAALEAALALHDNLKKPESVLKNEVIDALDSMVFNFPSFSPEFQLEILNTLCGSSGLLSPDVDIEISAVNCINSLARNLGARIIGFFPKIIPVLFSKCQQSLGATDAQDIVNGKTLQYATFALVTGFIVRIPTFMHSCTATVFELIFSSNIELEPREQLLTLIGERIDPQTVLNAYVSTWDYARHSVESMELFFRNLNRVIAATPKKLVGARASQLVGMLLKCFTVRSMQKFSLNQVNQMESVMVSTLIQVVLKLNDKVFRPQFLRIVRWAFDGENTVMAPSLRHTVFMKFAVKLFGQLKSIVTNYYGYILDHVCTILENPDDSFNLSHTIIKLIYQSLILSFSSDNDDFWQSPTRFNKIRTVLMAQIEGDVIQGNLLVKAIIALAEASSSQEHRKEINDNLGRLIGANNPATTKIWAVRVLSALYSKLGEEWVTGLPQLVPLIAELLDDDVEEVESEVRSQLVPVIEDVLGESLDRYLS